MVEENQRACKLGCFHQEELTLSKIKYNLKNGIRATFTEYYSISIFNWNRNVAKVLIITYRQLRHPALFLVKPSFLPFQQEIQKLRGKSLSKILRHAPLTKIFIFLSKHIVKHSVIFVHVDFLISHTLTLTKSYLPPALTRCKRCLVQYFFFFSESLFSHFDSVVLQSLHSQHASVVLP